MSMIGIKTEKPYCVRQRHLFFTCQLKNYTSIDDYLMKLKILSNDCDFGELQESLIRDRLICCVTDNGIKKLIFEIENPSLAQVVEIIQHCGKNTNEKSSIEASSSFVSAGKRSLFNPPPSHIVKCKFCSHSHGSDKRACAAWGKACKACGGLNHFSNSSMCMKSSSSKPLSGGSNKKNPFKPKF